VIGESNHPGDDFSEYGVGFIAKTATPRLRITNDTPGKDKDGNWLDCSVYIDEVTVTPIQVGAQVSLQNADFEDDVLAKDAGGYQYKTPSGWSGGGVIIASGAGPWGGVVSASGQQYIGLQGMGKFLRPNPNLHW
jgi:hypothetical protein